MAQQLDLQEQEQVDALKAFWDRHGNLIIWTVTIVLALFAAWQFTLKGQRDAGLQASTLYANLEDAARAGDAKRAGQVFADMKAQASTWKPKAIAPVPSYTQQGGLLAAKVLSEKGQTADAIAALQWVADNGNPENASVARLRIAGLFADDKKYDDALKQLDQVTGTAFAALVADRRGDILLAKGDKEGAKTAYKSAFDAMSVRQDYRFVLDAKLTALGAAPAISAASAAADAASAGGVGQ